jgi:hypothetical protein
LSTHRTGEAERLALDYPRVMDLDALLGDDDSRRNEAITHCLARSEHQRSMFAAKLSLVAKEAADALETAPSSEKKAACASLLGRACRALSLLRLEVAKTSLFRLADEGAPVVKDAIARSLSETSTTEARAVLVHLLSDDDGRESAIAAIGAGPWPEALPVLIEIAEADDRTARLALPGIANCAVTGGAVERAAAADFLLEQLDDEAVLDPAFEALMRHGRLFPGILPRAKRLAKEPGDRKLAALCLIAAFGDEGNASFLELALSGSRIEPEAAKRFLAPLLTDRIEHIRQAAERTWKALDLN